MQYVSPEPGFGSSFFIILGAIMMIGGIIQICRKRFIVDKGFEKYTKKSVEKFARYSGVTYIIAGLILIFGKLFRIEGTGDLLFWISIGIAVIAIIITCVMAAKIPKPKKKK